MVAFLFYYIQKKYRKWGEQDIPQIYALAFISLLQILNFFSLVVAALLLNVFKAEMLTDYIVVGISIVILLVNYLYIFKIKGSEIIVSLFEVKDKKFKFHILISWIYMITTIISFVVLLTFYVID